MIQKQFAERSRYTPLLLMAAVTFVAVLLAIGLTGPTMADEPLDSMDGDGSADDPYVITSVEELQAINEDPAAHYVLGNDIDASETQDWNTGQGFEPIGDDTASDRDTTPFTGTFDGQGHTIENLYIDRERALGLFGGIDDGTVKNVHLESPTVTGTSRHVGSLVGWMNGGTLDNVSAADVDVRSNDMAVGGLVGILEESATVEGAVASGTVEGDISTGGLVGLIESDSTIEVAYTSGTVDGIRAGGIAGQVRSDSPTLLAVGSSADIEAASGGIPGTGGLVGILDDHATVDRAFALGTVDGGENAGGFVGRGSGSTSETAIEEAYAAGDVSGENDVGGFGGTAPDSVHTVYWSSETSGVSEAFGDDDAEAIDIATDELTGTAVRDAMDLNFGHTWVATDEYPRPVSHVESLSLELEDPIVAVENETSVSVVLELIDGSTVTATKTAAFDLDTSIATVSEGTVETSAAGTTTITASLGDLEDSATLEVLTPPDIAVTDRSLIAEGAIVDEKTGVTVELENTGQMNGTEEVTVSTDEELVVSAPIDVPGESEVTQPLTWPVNSTGDYSIAVDGEAVGTVTVVERDTLELTGLETPNEVRAGEPYSITVTVDNDADLTVATPFQYTLAGETNQTFRTFESGTDTTSIEYTAGDVDGATETHQVTLLGDELEATTTVVVQEEESAGGDEGTDDTETTAPDDGSDDTTDGDDEPDDADDDGAGFSILVALVGVSTALLVANRQLQE